MTRQRIGSGRGVTRPWVVCYSLVDPVSGLHGGFTYVGGASPHKQTCRELTVAARRASYNAATEVYITMQEARITEKAQDDMAKAKVLGRVAIAPKKSDIKRLANPELAAINFEHRILGERFEALKQSAIAPPTTVVMGLLDAPFRRVAITSSPWL